MKKKLLFVINTLSRAGAEMALLALLQKLDPEKYDISLFVLMGQGELISEVPDYVHICNRRICRESVLTAAGRRHMASTMLKALLSRGTVIRRAPYLLRQSAAMAKQRPFRLDKLLWPVLADGAPRLPQTYDLAVAYLEGGSACYVANHVKAKKKAAFLHVDYPKAGYTRENDGSCYLQFDQIFAVSRELLEPFYSVYPELRGRMQVFENLLDTQKILRRAEEPGGFPEAAQGIKILSVGRLDTQKAFEYSIDAMKLLRDSGVSACWYVLGEGNQRSFLEKRIRENGLEDVFVLVGAVPNPYPWFRQSDLYVHCSRYEGKSIAIQEAQILGCAILVSDYSSNRELVTDGVNGCVCKLDAADICAGIQAMLADPKRLAYYRSAAAKLQFDRQQEVEKLLKLL